MLVVIFFCQCSSFCCCSSHCFSTSFLSLPWTITSVFKPHFILSAQPIAEWFATLSFVQPFCSCHERSGLEWAFFTHMLFYLALLSDIFGTTCFYQGIPGSRQFFSEVCTGLYWPSKHRPSPSAWWFTAIYNLLYILNLYLHMSILQKFLLVVKTLIKNIDQQLHFSTSMKIWSSSQTNQ